MVFNRRRTEYLWLLAALLVSGLAFFFLFRSGSRAVEEKRMTPDPVRISEIVAANLDFPDEEGRLYDWIEVENQTGSVQDLSGWGLSDEAEDVAYTFPQGTMLPPLGCLLVYCDRKAAENGAAPFGIS